MYARLISILLSIWTNVDVFAAVRRADRHPRICMLRTVAGDERSARRSLVRDYVLSLAARLPVVEVSRA